VAEIRYVVLSDLHFGAANSLMTSVVERSGVAPGGTFEADPTTPSPVLTAVLNCLRHLTAGQREAPTLVLAGDVLDLALSPDAVAATTFERFVDEAFAGPRRVFAPAVYYLPGNHDHHLWEGAREAQYIEYLNGLAAAAPMDPPWHTTRLLPDKQPPWTARDLISTLIQRRPGCADVAVRVVYPNLALVSPDGRCNRIVTHGHFTEPIYSLMSQLRQLLFPAQAPGAGGPTIANLEAENFAWIDFFWSTLGRSGDVGADVALIYAELTNPVALDLLAANLVHGLVPRGHGPGWLRPFETALLSGLARREVRHHTGHERANPATTLSPKGRLGLRQYLEGPLYRQLVAELGTIGADVGFVFGHTHKPFVERWSVAGYPGWVEVHNTGGWVVDTAEPAPTQGGVAVLLDDDLNLASLQFYRQTLGGGAGSVELLAATADAAGQDGGAGGNPLAARLAGEIDPTAEPWQVVSAAAGELIAQRHRLQAALLASGVTHT
jgi:hypothetical protein